MIRHSKRQTLWFDALHGGDGGLFGVVSFMKLLYGWSGLILVLLLVPLPGTESVLLGKLDLLMHFGLFVILGGLARRALSGNENRGTIVAGSVGLLLFGPETLQVVVPTRTFSLIDIFFNAGGIVSGVLLALVYPPLLHVAVGGISICGSWGTSFLEPSLYGHIFPGYFGMVPRMLVAINLVAFGGLFFFVDWSPLRQFLPVSGGLLYLVVFPLGGGVSPTIIAGILYLLVLTGRYRDAWALGPDSILSIITPLAYVLLTATTIGACFSKRTFSLHAGAILAVGMMMGTVLLYGLRSLSSHRTLSSRSPGHS